MPDSSNPVPEQSDWDDRENLWERKAFYVVKTPMFFQWPWRLQHSVAKAMEEAHNEGYQIPKQPMILVGPGLFSGEVLVEVSGIVAPTKRVRVFNDVPVYSATTKAPDLAMRKITREFSRRLREQGREFTQIYFWLKNFPECQDSGMNAILLALES